MSTEQPQQFPQAQQPTQMTILHRVASIPLVSSSLTTLDSTLSSNDYTKSQYARAYALGESAINYTTPYTQAALNHATIGPLIARADGLANSTLDVVEKNGYIGWVVKAKPEEVEGYVKERREGVEKAVRTRKESVEEFVKQRVEGLDQSLAPLVDYLASLAPPAENADENQKYQYQRALAISQAFANYSSDQANQFRTQSVLVQRAENTAASIQNLATTSYSSASTRIHGLSDSMLVELQKLQASTASVSASLQSTSHESLDKLKVTYGDLSKEFGETVQSLHSIMMEKDLPVQDKINKVTSEVQSRVQPLLENARKTVDGILNSSSTVPAPAKENGVAH